MSGTNPVISLEIQDSISPGARAAADALNKVGDAAVTVETKVGRVSASASTLVNRLDPATKSANALTAAQNALATSTDTLNRALTNGDISQEQYNASLATLQQRVRAANEALSAGVTSHGQLSAAMHGTSLSLGQVAPQFVQLFTSIQAGQPIITSLLAQGHQLGDQMLVTGTSVSQLAGVLGSGLRSALGAVLSPLGLAITAAAAAGVAVYALGAAAETSADRIAKLQASLQAVNGAGAANAGRVGNTAARNVANTGISSLADSTASAIAFLNQPSVTQTPANIERLIKDSADLATVWGVTMPDAAKKLAAGLSDPGKLAKELADDNYHGMNDELARSIQLQADAGDKAGAYAKVLGVVEAAAHNAANTSKTELQQALAGLSGAFTKAGTDGKTFADTIGDKIDHLASGAVTSIADMVRALEKAYGFVNSLNLPDWVLKSIGNAASGAINPIGGIVSAIGGVSPPGTAPVSNASVAPQLSAAAAAYGIDPALLARLQAAEGVQNPDGSWQTSSTGAVGPMQVTGTTFRGIASQPATFNALGLTNNADVGQNITAGAALFAHLLKKYGDPSLAILAYHDGEPLIDQVLAGNGSPSQAAQDEARKALSGYSGTGLTGVVTGTPIDVTGAASTNNPSKVIQDALTAATSGSSFETADKAKASVTQYTTALAALAAQGVTSGHDVDVLDEALTRATKSQFDAIGPAAQLIRTISEQIAQQDELTAAWNKGYAAEGQAVAQVKAEQQARTVAAPGTAAYADAVQRLTAANLALAAAQQSTQAGAALADQAQEVQYLQAEAATISESAATRARDLAVLKEQQTIAKTMPAISQQEKDALLAGAAAIADQNTNLQQTQAALAEVGNLATQAFDQIGSAISSSFLSGTGAAINWGNTVKAVVGTVIQSVAKLAILNPAINFITGGNSPTLGSVVGALGTTSSNGGALGLLSNGSSLISDANTLSGGWLGNSLGITGPNGVLSNAGNYFSGASNYLFGAGTGSLNTATLGAQPIGFASDAANAATYGSTSPGIFASNGAVASFANTPVLGAGTIGSFAGGIGAGYGVGSLAGGYIQGALNKTGPAPQIGAAVGAVGGAIIGSIIPGVGTVIGGLIGGTLGGAGGGLIGPHVATPYSNIEIAANSDGQLQIGKGLSQLDSNFAAEVTQARSAADALNTLMSQSGIHLANLGIINRIGDAIDPNAPGKATDIASAFPGFHFTVPDTSTDLGRVLSKQVSYDKSFSGIDQLQSVFTEVSTFVNQTVPALKSFDAAATGVGSFATALSNLHAMFDPAITEAQKLGYAEQDLTDARDKAVAAAEAQVNAQVAGYQNSIQASYLAAHAQVTGNQADAQTASLFAFDNITATQDRQQVKDEYQAIFGDAYATTAQYVQASTALEQSLSEQRLAIQTQFNGQAEQAAGASITSLTNYIQKLQGSDVSPLSPLAQYSQARSQFNAVSGAARAGDYNSIGNLPTYADALLSASRNVNGSGTGYVNDYNSVLSSVSSVAALGADALTQSFMAAQMQGQTVAIVTAIQSLQTEVSGLQTALSQAAMQPARIAA